MLGPMRSLPFAVADTPKLYTECAPLLSVHPYRVCTPVTTTRGKLIMPASQLGFAYLINHITIIHNHHWTPASLSIHHWTPASLSIHHWTPASINLIIISSHLKISPASNLKKIKTFQFIHYLSSSK